jgi:hypothetical protein
MSDVPNGGAVEPPLVTLPGQLLFVCVDVVVNLLFLKMTLEQLDKRMQPVRVKLLHRRPLHRLLHL